MNSMVYLAFMIIAGMFIIMAFAAYAALATKKRRWKKGENMTTEQKQAQDNIMQITQRKALKMTCREILKDEIDWVWRMIDTKAIDDELFQLIVQSYADMRLFNNFEAELHGYQH